MCFLNYALTWISQDQRSDSQELLKSFFLAFLFISVPRGLVGYMFLGNVLMLRDERLYADMEPGENEWLRATERERERERERQTERERDISRGLSPKMISTFPEE